jgi:large subunit ribosomal protein L4
VHAARGSIAVLDASSFEEPSTQQAAKALERWGASRPTLVALGPDEGAAAKSFRNIPGIAVLAADSVGVADVVGAASVVLSETALEGLSRRASGQGGESAGPEADASGEEPSGKGDG